MTLALPRHFFYAAIIFALLITGGVTLVNEIQNPTEKSNVDTSVDLMDSEKIHELNTTFMPNATKKMDELQNNLRDLRVSNWGEAITLPGAIIKTAWNVVEVIIESATIMNKAITGLGNNLGISGIGWIVVIIISLIFALFVFSIISIVFGKDV